MRQGYLILVAAALIATPALAEDRAAFDRRYPAYDACMLDAAVRASYTDLSHHQVFEAARAQCAAPRARVARHAPAAVKAADAERAERLPLAISTLRDRRRTLGALYGIADPALR